MTYYIPLHLSPIPPKSEPFRTSRTHKRNRDEVRCSNYSIPNPSLVLILLIRYTKYVYDVAICRKAVHTLINIHLLLQNLLPDAQVPRLHRRWAYHAVKTSGSSETGRWASFLKGHPGPNLPDSE